MNTTPPLRAPDSYRLIGNSEYKTWLPAIRELDMERLGACAVDAYAHIDPWWEKGVYFWSGMADANGKLVSSISVLLLNDDEFGELCAGKKVETNLHAYRWESFERPVLYWATLILGDKHHAPVLFRSVCRSLLKNLANSEAPHIEEMFCIPASRASQLLLMRYKQFSQKGLYKGKYPIIAAPIKEFPILDAFLTPHKDIVKDSSKNV